MKGIGYFTKRPSGEATSSTDEEDADDGEGTADSEVDVMEVDGEYKPANSPREPRLKAAGSSIKNRRDFVSFVHSCIITDSET